MKYLKICLLFFILIFLNSCGFKNLNSEKINNFRINITELKGDTKLVNILRNNLLIYAYPGASIEYDLKISLTLFNQSKIKNITGKTTRYSTTLNANTKITNKKTQQSYLSSFNSINYYDVSTTHSETLKNERKAINNNLNQISDQILKYLRLINLQI